MPRRHPVADIKLGERGWRPADFAPEVTAEAERQVLAEVARHTIGFAVGCLETAALLGYAHLLEGQLR